MNVAFSRTSLTIVAVGLLSATQLSAQTTQSFLKSYPAHPSAPFAERVENFRPGFAGVAPFESKHFVVHAPDPRLARQVSKLAEKYRRELAIEWLGHELPDWKDRCPIVVELAPDAGGETSFAFVPGANGQGVPVDWQMKIFGPPDRVLDAVLPHEITHTIFATHFGQPLPRWADEGACTTVEHASERQKNHQMLLRFLKSQPSRGIPFNRMFTMKRYPHDILPLYAQGFSVAKFLIHQRGRKHFLDFVGFGLEQETRQPGTTAWDEATRKFYGYQDLSDLQLQWQAWVKEGSDLTKLELFNASRGNAANAPVAAATAFPTPPQPDNAVRSLQDPAVPEANGTRLAYETVESWYESQGKRRGTAAESGQTLTRTQRQPTDDPRVYPAGPSVIVSQRHDSQQQIR